MDCIKFNTSSESVLSLSDMVQKGEIKFSLQNIRSNCIVCLVAYVKRDRA